MRTIFLIVILSVLAACATPSQQAAEVEREVERMMTVYGPACEKLGFKSQTDLWRNCIVNLNMKDELERARRYSDSCLPLRCMGWHF